jgi:hypothetical protein
VDTDEAEPYQKRGVTHLHVKQPVFTFGLLALDLFNLSAPGLAQLLIFSAIPPFLLSSILNIAVW